MLKTIKILSIVLVALTLAGKVDAAEKYIVQNGSPAPGSVNLDIYVANRLGFFADEGLDVEMRYSQGAPQATQIAASGAADMARVSFEPYLSGYSKGLRGKFYMRSNYHNIFWLAVLEGSDIKAVGDLKDKKIGVINMGSGALVVARSMLRQAGIQPDNSMFLPVGAGPSALRALQEGKVSAVALWDAGYSALERHGAKLKYLHHPVIGKIGNSGFFISDASLKSKQDAHVKFLRAVVKARAFIGENKDAALKMYWDEIPGAKVGDTPEQQHANGMAEITFMQPFPAGIAVKDLGRFNLDDLAKYLAVMKEEAVLEANLSVADIFSNELLDKIGPINLDDVLRRAPKKAP
ncbi:MAG TPA: ABC transporter substrate-binding protein [Xanthobacteraceae bacterium]|nr:ABC transporter substrate-binding protein [Xanthobacteraceae bacterium]